MMEKLAFALVTTSKKLRHYFQAHVINFMTDHPLRRAMNKLEAVGQLIQWGIKLSEFDIRYQPRNAIKVQALANFIAKFTPSHGDLDEENKTKAWIVQVNGSSTLYVGGIRVVLKFLEGDKLKYTTRLQYQTTNNEIEYEALLKGLELAKSLGVESIVVQGDSQLIISQVNGICETKEENMEADALAKATSADGSVDKLDKVQYMPSIDLPKVQQIKDQVNWMTPIIVYLRDGRLLEEKKNEARKLRIRLAKYALID